MVNRDRRAYYRAQYAANKDRINARRKEHYQANKDQMLADARESYIRNKAVREANDRKRWTGKRRASCNARRKVLLEEKKAQLDAIKTAAGCLDCGNKETVVLEFDHVRGKKLFNISSNKPWPALLKEIKKCDVRCANCHRRRHGG